MRLRRHILGRIAGDCFVEDCFANSDQTITWSGCWSLPASSKTWEWEQHWQGNHTWPNVRMTVYKGHPAISRCRKICSRVIITPSVPGSRLIRSLWVLKAFRSSWWMEAKPLSAGEGLESDFVLYCEASNSHEGKQSCTDGEPQTRPCCDEQMLAGWESLSLRTLSKNFSSLLVKNFSIDKSPLELSVESCNFCTNSCRTSPSASVNWTMCTY